MYTDMDLEILISVDKCMHVCMLICLCIWILLLRCTGSTYVSSSIKFTRNSISQRYFSLLTSSFFLFFLLLVLRCASAASCVGGCSHRSACYYHLEGSWNLSGRYSKECQKKGKKETKEKRRKEKRRKETKRKGKNVKQLRTSNRFC